MSGPVLDKFARRAARHLASDSAGGLDTSLTRRAVIGRGLLGAFALSGFGRFVAPEQVRAAPQKCPGGSLAACNRRIWENHSTRTLECSRIYHDRDTWRAMFNKYACYRDHHEDARKLSTQCRARCAPPKGKKPPSTARPPSRSVPPLPPNPYDTLVFECANCTSSQVGGVCCYGGPDPRHLCACGPKCKTPDCKEIPCSFFGCT